MSEPTHQPAFQAPEIGEVARLFPAYDIHTLIACGGMGAVYQATQRSLDRTVAIKILPREFSTDSAFRAGFEAEAKAMAKLNHPNLIGVYDFGEAGGMLYIVMEYVAGKSLFHSAHGFAVDQAEALAIVIGVCEGLANAHENGVLHRDIKPSNILLDANANPKIGDFGLARALEREIEEGEQIFGTPGYTAPEVLTPPYAIDQRADIYSVGVMLHELLTGKLPDADPRPTSQICGCNQRLDAIIFRALHPDPKYRYASAAELAEDLGKISTSPSRALLTSNAPPSTGKAPAAPALRRPALVPARPPSALSSSGNPKALAARPALGAQRPLSTRPATKVSAQESYFGSIMLGVILVVAIIVAFAVLSKDKTPPAPAAPPAPEAPVLPGEPAAAADADAVKDSPADPAAALNSAKSSIRLRVEPLLETHRRDLESDPGNRASLEGKLDADLKSLAGIYVLELQNQIEQLSKDGNQAAVNALEEEVRRVQSDPGYFRSAMQR
ncbi:serine/threonine protein kinase [Akkermansiaceae bacterium]|nr:serine/threonine protein kinase [Akkermansiaceae bacterium]